MYVNNNQTTTMKDKNAYTPIAVGAVIAVLGVLLGLYFAQNANERLASYDNGQQTATDTLATQQPPLPYAEEADSMVAPMPLEPIDIEVPPMAEDESADAVEEIATPTPVDEVPKEKEDTTTEETEEEIDDFVEVDPASEEAQVPQTQE